MRADRLLKMMLLLQKNRQMRAQDLAEIFEVSLSTIYRDIDALSIAGIPIYTQPGTNGGIFMDAGFRASLTDFSQNQILALFLANNAQALQDIGLADTAEVALLKLFNTLPVSNQDAVRHTQQRLYIDSTSWFRARDMSSTLEIIQQAVWTDQRLQLVYQSDNHPASYTVSVDAYALVAKANHWYLIGRKDSGDYRTYRLTRIVEIQVVGEGFSRDSSFDLPVYWKSTQQHYRDAMAAEFPIFEVEMRVHTSAYWYLVKVLEGQFEQIELPDAEHWGRVAVQFHSEYEAKSHILAMAHHVKVISPVHLQAEMKNLIKDLAQYYAQS